VVSVKPSEGDDARPDGGSASPPIAEEIFTRTSDVPELSRSEKVFRWLDVYLYAPLAVAWNDFRARIGLVLVGLFLFVSTLGPVLVDQTVAMEAAPFIQPFEQPLKHPFGTDSMGRDLFAMVIHATPAMFEMIAAGALFSICMGTFIGTVAGYKGGMIDSVFMTLTDVVLTIPALPLVIVIASVYQPTDPAVVGLILGIDNWPVLARTLRSQVLSIREEAFTEASRAMGLRKSTILRKDVISNMAPYISVNLATSARRIIFESVGLYYIGVLPFTTLNWGVMLNQAYTSGQLTNLDQIHWLLVPMGALILVSLGFIMLAQGMDRVFNVRLRARHAKTRGGEDEDEAAVPE
jgi:peptide/nickel transport system permease protein